MRALGDKIGSTIIAQSAGVPTIAWNGDGLKVVFLCVVCCVLCVVFVFVFSSLFGANTVRFPLSLCPDSTIFCCCGLAGLSFERAHYCCTRHSRRHVLSHVFISYLCLEVGCFADFVPILPYLVRRTVHKTAINMRRSWTPLLVCFFLAWIFRVSTPPSGTTPYPVQVLVTVLHAYRREQVVKR